MFAILEAYVNTINTWAEPHNAEGVTANTVIDSNDEVPQKLQTSSFPHIIPSNATPLGGRTITPSPAPCHTSTHPCPWCRTVTRSMPLFVRASCHFKYRG
jgi:hypothetical protein